MKDSSSARVAQTLRGCTRLLVRDGLGAASVQPRSLLAIFCGLSLAAILLGACSARATRNTSEDRPPSAAATPAADGHTDAASPVSAYIVEAFEDRAGNLWFGTVTDGVARYDGKSLTYLSTADGLCDNTVPGIAQDAEGNMWFGTHDGASRYDGKTFTNFKSADGLRGWGCKILVDSKGNVWAGTTEGAFRLNGKTFTAFEIPEPVIDKPSYKVKPGKIWSLTEDSKGNIWFGRDGFGACKYDGSTFTHLTQKDGLCSNNVSRIVEDDHGNMWFSSITSDFPEYIQEGGLSRYDGRTIHQYPHVAGLTKSDIYSLYMTPNGDLWTCSVGLGAYRMRGDKFELFDKTDGAHELMKYFAIQSILQDRKGRLWFGFSGGLFRFDGAGFKQVTQAGPWATDAKGF